MPPADRFGHVTRFSDSSLCDEVCTLCGATDRRGDPRLQQQCPGSADAAAPEPSPSRPPIVRALPIGSGARDGAIGRVSILLPGGNDVTAPIDRDQAAWLIADLGRLLAAHMLAEARNSRGPTPPPDREDSA